MSDDDNSPDWNRDRDEDEDRNQNRDEDHTPNPDQNHGTGVLGVLREVLDALVDAERTGGSDVLGGGRRSRGATSVEYGFSGRLGGLGDESGTAANSESSRSIRNIRSTGGEEYLVDVREDDGEVVVVADVAGVDVDDVTVGLADDRTTLVVGVGDEPPGRLDLPWRAADAVPRHHHGVLEIRITPEEDDG